MRYSTRAKAYEELLRQRNPDGADLLEKSARMLDDKGVEVRYIVDAMQPIGARYSEICLEQAERVRNQIEKGLAKFGLTAEYRFQGSVIKGTNVKGYSDVDLLVIENRFFVIEHPQTATHPYQGEPLDDLAQIRTIVSAHLSSAFPEATINTSKPKSVKIEGGSLLRIVDIVPANWFNTNDYATSGLDHHRGIHIFDAVARNRIPDRPFYHVHLIEVKDGESNGSYRKLVRFLKIIKGASDEEMFSSFDIEALMYSIPSNRLASFGEGDEVALAREALRWLRSYKDDATVRDNLTVPDGQRKIFAPGYSTEKHLNNMIKELEDLLRPVEMRLLLEGEILDKWKIRYREMVEPKTSVRIFG